MSVSRKGLLPRVLGAVLLALVPVVATAFSPWAAATGLLVLGMLPTLTAAGSGPKAMAASAGVSGVTAFLAVLAASAGPWVPVLGVALVVVLSLATGALAVRGLHPVGAATISLAAYVLVDPSSVVAFLDTRIPSLTAAGLVAVVILLGCAWALAVVAVMLRGVRLPANREAATLPYGVLLAALCGGFTLICVLWFAGTNAWWAVLTVAVILQPTYGQTRTKMYGRILGTVLGGTTAALVVLVLPATIAVLLGVVASLASVLLLMADADYWKYSTAVTVSVILLTFDSTTAIAGDLQRVTVTIVAAVVTAAAVGIATRLLPDRLLEQREPAPETP